MAAPTESAVNAERMRLLSDYLAWCGVKPGVQAGWLGYYAGHGPDDMDRVVEDESTLISRDDAFAFLRNKFSVTDDDLATHAARPAARAAQARAAPFAPAVVDAVLMTSRKA